MGKCFIKKAEGSPVYRICKMTRQNIYYATYIPGYEHNKITGVYNRDYFEQGIKSGYIKIINQLS